MRSRPIVLEPLLRTSWRVPIIGLLVASCRQRRAKREQFVVLNWALRDSATHDALVVALSGEKVSRHPAIRYEPALVRAVNIAHGAGLLGRDGDWMTLTASGEALIQEIEKDDLYRGERAALDAMPKPLSFSLAQALLAGRS